MEYIRVIGLVLAMTAGYILLTMATLGWLRRRRMTMVIDQRLAEYRERVAGRAGWPD